MTHCLRSKQQGAGGRASAGNETSATGEGRQVPKDEDSYNQLVDNVPKVVTTESTCVQGCGVDRGQLLDVSLLEPT